MYGLVLAEQTIQVGYIAPAMVVSAIVGALIGNTKGHTVIGLILGALLGCIGWIITLLLPRRVN